jgi:HK97 family phage portal protein
VRLAGASGVDVAVKAGSILDDWPWSAQPPTSWQLGGPLLSTGQAVGLPAVLAALLWLSDTVSMLPSQLYERDRTGDAQPVFDGDDYEMFAVSPDGEISPGAFRADIVLALAGAGNAFIRKWKARGKVKQLEVLDVRYVRARRSGGQVVFDDYSHTGSPGDALTRTRSDIIHLRLGRLNASSANAYSPEGISPITAARMAFALGLKRQAFEGAYFDNDARPGIALTFPQSVNEDEAKIWVDLYKAQHQGIDRKHGVSVLGGGADLKVIPISLKDAQFVEGRQMTIREAGGIYKIPASFLGDAQSRAPQSPDVEAMRFARFGAGPYLTIMDEGFSRDTDLFPRPARGGSRRYIRHQADELLRPDFAARMAAWKDARQGGWVTLNEIRQKEDLPARPDGDELQQTPVGGESNKPNGDATPADDNNDDSTDE